MKKIGGKDTNLLSKTPEKVKKGLECCSKNVLDPCIGCPYERIGDDEWKCGLNADALALIQQLEAQVPKWISVEEGLPEDGRYLVLTKKEDDTKKVHTATYNSFGWWTYANFGEITHWMPLPELPKKGRA